MKLHVVARVYGGENRKGRPAYYSKRTSLASLLLATERADGQFTLLADGPISDELAVMACRTGRVVQLPGGPVGLRRSFIAALDFVTESSWPSHDLVYFCEDDYLHQPDALLHLHRAVRSIPEASYFALYASTPDNPAIPGVEGHILPVGWTPYPEAVVDDICWVNVPSTTSTFAVPVGVLRQDRAIFRQSLLPYRRRLLDHESFLVLQGIFPYSWKDIVIGPMSTRFRSGVALVAANAFLAPFRMAYQARALTRRMHPHVLYAADPNMATHLESGALAPGTDWAKIAVIAEHWIQQNFTDLRS